MNTDKAVHLGHNFGGLFTYFPLILNTFSPICNVRFLNSFCSFYGAP